MNLKLAILISAFIIGNNYGMEEEQQEKENLKTSVQALTALCSQFSKKLSILQEEYAAQGNLLAIFNAEQGVKNRLLGVYAQDIAELGSKGHDMKNNICILEATVATLQMQQNATEELLHELQLEREIKRLRRVGRHQPPLVYSQEFLSDPYQR